MESLQGSSRRNTSACSVSGHRSAKTNCRTREIRIRHIRSRFKQSTTERLRALKPAILDTGVIVALLDRSENNHARCVHAVKELAQPLVTCEAVIAESCYLLRTVGGAAEAVVENVEKGVFQIPFSIHRSAAFVRRLIRKYRDHDIDFCRCLPHSPR